MNCYLPQQQIHKAVRLLKRGGLIAFPTETYYGLGVDPFNSKALERLFAVKQRSIDKAVLVLVHNKEHIHQLVRSVPKAFDPLMDRFWPGGLTLVFPAQPALPDLLTGGSGTIGIRQSSNGLAAQLVKEFSRPITATSANRSGHAAATTAKEVAEIFSNEVDLILDGGPTPGGQGSTLVGYQQELICIRQGIINFDEIASC